MSVVVHVVIHKDLKVKFTKLIPDFTNYALKEVKGSSIYYNGEVDDTKEAVIINFVRSNSSKAYAIAHDTWSNINLVNSVYYQEHGDYGDNPDFHIYGDMCIIKNNVPEVLFYELVVKDLIERNPELTAQLMKTLNSLKNEQGNLALDFKNEVDLSPF